MLFSKLERLPLGSIKAAGFLKEQLKRNKTGMGGHLPDIEPGMIANPYVNKTNVKQWQGGQQSGWGAEISGNYYTGLIQLAFVLDDEELKKKAEVWVNAVLGKQREDGYLGTYFEPDALIYEDYNAWGTACGMNALLYYYEATSREDVFQAVYRCMVWFAETWSGDKKTCYVGSAICEPCIYCYKKTGDKRLLDFCVDYMEYLPGKTCFNNSYEDFALPKLKYNSNHTAGYGSNVRMPAIVYSACGRKEYLSASENGIKKIQEKATQLTGGPVSVAEYVGPIGSVNETEYCSFAFFNRTYAYLNAITGDSKYSDYAEIMIYNGAEGARKKDERAIAYLSAPNQIYATNKSSPAEGDMQVYAPCYPVSCCPVNSVVVIPEFIRGMAYTDEEGNLYLSNYGPCRIEHGGWILEEETQYPFRNSLTIRIDGNNGRKLFCRIPGWAKAYTIKVDGLIIDVKKNEHGYVCINQGSVIEIVFDADIEVIRVDDTDASNKRPIAFKYGALLFALKIEADWEPYYPKTETPLTPEWPWYNVLPKKPKLEGNDWYENIGLERSLFPWAVAVDENITASDVKIELCSTEGYPWEDAYIKLHLPAYQAPLACAPYASKTFEPHGDKLEVSKQIELTLVPLRATNLRIAYFPRADV